MINSTESLPGSMNLPFVERLYEQYARNAESVPPEWRDYFDRLSGNGHGKTTREAGERPPDTSPRKESSRLDLSEEETIRQSSGASGDVETTAPRATAPPAADRTKPHDGNGRRRTVQMAVRQDRVDQLIRAYRVRGHIVARIDPLGIPRAHQPELDPEFYGFSETDLDQPFSSRTISGPNIRTLRQIIERMRNTYCRSIGVQFMHIDDLGIRHWLQDHMEGTENRVKLTRAEQVRILTRLTDAVIFEEFVQKKYIGAKSFSLEGAESLIPLLDLAIEKAGNDGIEEIVMAMAHRGRLNVLANIIGKRPHQIFREFEDREIRPHSAGGDVKYHLGYSSDWRTAAGRNVHLSLCFNPSHLEFVDPVALGRMRAKQDRAGDLERRRGMVLMIHGDASFAGEGIIQETLNLSELAAYTTGGSIHVIVNNQIGFTTPPSEARSSLYASGPAKMLQLPIFHVNGEDPEAVAQVVRLALDFRREFNRDVVIDMYCYRRHGHNEGDEPEFTQPLLYGAIKQRKSVREGYLEHLLKLGEITREEADAIATQRRESLERDLSVARSEEYELQPQTLTGIWGGYTGGAESLVNEVRTAVDRNRLAALLEVQTRLPPDFHPHPKIERFLQARREMAQGRRPIDWSAAEALAFASLATEGLPVRMSGQDTARGTFTQRHAVLHDIQDGKPYVPLQHLAPEQAPVEIYNSPLSEAGVLGFEYGYSLDCPDGLVLWEAQFGDFVNAAQVIIDQFIASGEEKWHRLSGVVLLLPHGFEGQGPEHSSARLERFLALAAEYNIQVVYPSTPAQYFHLLRRQVLSPWRKPLVVMTPKSLLRHPGAACSLEELAIAGFQRIMPDELPKDNIQRILLCSGKIYYELADERHRLGRGDVAIVRIEQLYPLEDEVLYAALAPYSDGTRVYWVQEEPENMGAWRYMRARFGNLLLSRLPFRGVYRPASSSPATGSARTHQAEQRHLIERAFGDGGTE